MTATPPTRQQITDLAERRTADLGFPKEPPASAGNLDLYREERQALLDQQIRNAELGLTRIYERDRDAEADAAKRGADERATLEASLVANYRAASPGTTEAEARAALPDLLHRHRLAQMNQQDENVARARLRMHL